MSPAVVSELSNDQRLVLLALRNAPAGLSSREIQDAVNVDRAAARVLELRHDYGYRIDTVHCGKNAKGGPLYRYVLKDMALSGRGTLYGNEGSRSKTAAAPTAEDRPGRPRPESADTLFADDAQPSTTRSAITGKAL